MTYKITERDNLQIIEVCVPYDEFSVYVGQAYEHLAKQKGKEYASITEFIDENGTGELNNLALNIALSQGFDKAVSESDIVVISEPKVQVVSAGFNTGADTVFTFEIEKAPEFTLGKYKGLEIKLNQKTPSVTVEEIERKEKEIVMKSATFEEVDGALENGQMSVIDFEGSVNGELFEGGSAQDYELIIGSGMFIPGFEEQMVGMVKGETRIVKVRFPDAYAPELAGKDAEFKVTLKAIKVKNTPELTKEVIEAYGKERGVEISTREQLQAQLRMEIYKQKDEMVQREIAEKLQDALYENTQIEIPAQGVEFEAQYQLNEYKQQAAQYGMQLETFVGMLGMKSIDDLLEELRAQARKNIALTLIIRKIIEVEGIEASDEEIENYLSLIAKSRNTTIDDVKTHVPRGKVKEHLETQQALKLVRDTATILYA
jgi:trigger factor